MAIRQFSLKNGNSDVISLNNIDTFGYDPTGLGLSFNNEFYGANANFLNESIAIAQQVFTIKILLGADSFKPYEKYNELAQFLSIQPIYLVYGVPGVGTYEKQVLLADMPKTEINENNVIEETIQFDSVTPWYQWHEMSSDIMAEYEDDGKIYNYAYPFAYYSNKTANNNYYLINNDSLYMGTSLGSPLEINIKAVNDEIVNPGWRILQNSIEVQNDRYFLTIPKGATLTISSDPQEQKAILTTADGSVSNIYQYQDMTRTNFVSAPLGKSTIVFDDIDAEISVNLKKEWVVL